MASPMLASDSDSATSDAADNRSSEPSSSEPTVRISDVPPNTRRCFVCLGDEPEAALPSDWSTPCSCSLEGHQDCLLTWVADLEAQAKDVKCPVCKSPIVVTERWDPAIQLSNFLNQKFSKWSPRIMLGFVASGTLVSSAIYGAKAIDWFAGPEATMAFLFKHDDLPWSQFLRRFDPPRTEPPINLLHFSLLPLIAPGLIVNRMNGVGEVFTIPASLYAMIFNPNNELLAWPPSPDRAMALYPALKASYFHIHRVISTRLEKAWTARALHARGDSEHPGVAPADDVQPAAPEDENLLDFEIDIQIGGGEEDAPADAGGQPARRAVDATRQNPVNFIAGALLWPGVSYGMGELMRTLLPARLITKPAHGQTTGLLQERWGRSLVGGCLFVVLKDAFFLWVKYRKDMNRPHRKIKNSERRNLRN
ncbi:Uu.00g008740.m01.CDS01 [Anthostomella pinea]|uniref:Uu.00g008740.m01.CDS01 n=1 Tax=Anthostomella pinea TaxID=933095 RepID=A0AAI8YPY4_9PEZI|nr:Uu.00g008740.m01.CDS01 [Anthostomella pinea]